jgi:alpha,alpha-trehalase
MRHEGGTAAQPALRDAEQNLRAALADVEGVLIEPKGFALAVHFRLVGESDLPKVEHAVREVADSHPELRRTGGKKIFELRPDIDWDKGRAVLWVLEALGLEGEDTLTIYLGDDETDEDAFRALRNRGIGIFVGEPGADTRADYVLPDTSTVGDFLRALADETEKHGGRKSA